MEHWQSVWDLRQWQPLVLGIVYAQVVVMAVAVEVEAVVVVVVQHEVAVPVAV